MQEPSLQHFTMIVLDSGFLSSLSFSSSVPITIKPHNSLSMNFNHFKPICRTPQAQAEKNGPQLCLFSTAEVGMFHNAQSFSHLKYIFSYSFAFRCSFKKNINKVLVECNHPEHWKIKLFAKLKQFPV